MIIKSNQKNGLAIGFLENLNDLIWQIHVTTLAKGSLPRLGALASRRSRGKPLALEEGIRSAIEFIRECSQRGKKLIFIGNGGSAGIASHQAVDYWKNGKIKAIAFNDASLLTCISNDYGYHRVFAEPIKRFAENDDLLMALSSSGSSKNILTAVSAARECRCRVITFSGFSQTNPLRSKGDINFYVPSNSYGHVEILHLSLLHSMLDEIILSSNLQND